MIFGIDQTAGGRTALLAPGGESVSYADLVSFVRDISSAVPARGLTFCMCRNMPGAVMGYLAFTENGFAPLLLDGMLPPEQFDSLFKHYFPSYVWLPASRAEAYKTWLDEKIYGSHGYELWTTGCEPYPVNPELALLLATSGSTGEPKLVRLSRENIESNASSIAEYLHIDENERPITTLPMQYTYGLSIINSHLAAGACILMTTSSYVQQPFWDFFRDEKATSFGGVPYTYEILKKIHIFNKSLPSLRYCTQAGGKLPPQLQIEVAQWAEKNGSLFYVMYGQTEATARMGYLPPEKCLSKPGSMGIAIPGGRFELADQDGNIIEGAHKSGELVYIGPNVSLGYASSREDLMLGDVNRGRLLTGDIAQRDEDGYYYIVGRKKRFLKIFGIRTSLDACEKFLQERYPDAQIMCGGEDNDLRIYSTDEDAAAHAAEDLSDWLHQSIRAFSSYHISKIPRNEYGKIMFKDLDKYVDTH